MKRLNPPDSLARILLRGLVHILLGLAIALAGLFLSRFIFLFILGAITFIFILTELIRFRHQPLNNWFCSFLRPLLRDRETSRLTGASYILIASLLVFLFFDKNVAALAVSFMALGDAVATIVGKCCGKHRIYGKTLEGNLACLAACLLTAFTLSVVGLPVSLITALIGAVTATVTESLPLPVNDNLAIPLLSALVMTLLPF
ncbi:diacylglycerol/polyprenol kinase family protein [Chloroflexota bacterium]